jgi:hypothetical protein
MHDLLDERAAAQLLGVKPRTLQVMRARGDGPTFLKIGRSVRYSTSDLSKYVDRNRFVSLAECAEAQGRTELDAGSCVWRTENQG